MAREVGEEEKRERDVHREQDREVPSIVRHLLASSP